MGLQAQAVVAPSSRLPAHEGACVRGGRGKGSLSIGGALRNMTSFIVKSGVATEEEYTNLIDKAIEEWDVHGVQFPCRIATARKPSTSMS